MTTARLLWRSSGGSDGTYAPLSDVALVLLLVLVHFPAHHAQRVNPVKQALTGLRDASLSAGMVTPAGGSNGGAADAVVDGSPLVSFARLYDFCAAGKRPWV